MNRMRLKLIPGKEYLFSHKRRGTLHARYLRIVRAPGTDPDDEYYLDCEILSAGLLPGEKLSISASTLLRPSMISLMQDVPANYSPGVTSSTSKTSSEDTSRTRIGNALRKLLRGLRVG